MQQPIEKLTSLHDLLAKPPFEDVPVSLDDAGRCSRRRPIHFDHKVTARAAAELPCQPLSCDLERVPMRELISQSARSLPTPSGQRASPSYSGYFENDWRPTGRHLSKCSHKTTSAWLARALKPCLDSIN